MCRPLINQHDEPGATDKSVFPDGYSDTVSSIEKLMDLNPEFNIDPDWKSKIVIVIANKMNINRPLYDATPIVTQLHIDPVPI
jgi:hypothetical protein